MIVDGHGKDPTPKKFDTALSIKTGPFLLRKVFIYIYNIYTLIFQFPMYLEPGAWLPDILATGSLVPNI